MTERLGVGGVVRHGLAPCPQGQYSTKHPLHWAFQIQKECLTCRGAAAVFNMSYFGKFYLLGVDARKAADWLFSADVNRPPGTGPREEGSVALLLQCQMEQRWGEQAGGLLFFPGSNQSAIWPSMPCHQPQPQGLPLFHPFFFPLPGPLPFLLTEGSQGHKYAAIPPGTRAQSHPPTIVVLSLHGCQN